MRSSRLLSVMPANPRHSCPVRVVTVSYGRYVSKSSGCPLGVHTGR